MADREELLRVAERCEAASGPDREMDAKVARAVGRIPPHAKYEGTMKIGDMAWTGGLGFDVPAYTTSLDAAMTLVPEGWKIAHISQVDTDKPLRQWFAELRRGFITSYDKALPIWAATPALALAAASLRARAQDPLRAHGGGE